MTRAVALALLLAMGAAGAETPKGAIQIHPERIVWRSAPNLPPGAQSAVLEGDPSKDGLFTMRLKAPAGTRLAPHWHPRDERVTVLSGVVMVGFGEVADETAGARFAAGGFYVNPANSRHYIWFPEDSIVQITGVGPWELYFVTSAAPKP